MWQRKFVTVLYIAYAALIIAALAGQIVSLRTAVIACLGLHMAGLLFSLVILKNTFGWNYTYPVKEFRRLYVAVDVLQGAALAVVISLSDYNAAVAAAAIALVGVAMCIAKTPYWFEAAGSGGEKKNPPAHNNLVRQGQTKQPLNLRY